MVYVGAYVILMQYQAHGFLTIFSRKKTLFSSRFVAPALHLALIAVLHVACTHIITLSFVADTLYTAAGQQCSYSSAPYTVIALSAPKWLDTWQAGQALNLSFTLQLTSGVMGFTFMYSSPANHFFFLLNAATSTVQFGRCVSLCALSLSRHLPRCLSFV